MWVSKHVSSFRPCKYTDQFRSSSHNSTQQTSAVRRISSHFEYLENRSRGLDVTWQPLKGNLTAHPWTVTLPWG